MRRFKFAKLVRDKIVEGIISVGNKPNYRKLRPQEYISELKRKILEEAQELTSIEDKEELLKELADLQEIIDNLLIALNISRKQLKNEQLRKNQKAGSFKKQLFVEDVEAKEENKKWIDYYLANPHKYPEIK